MRKGLAVWGLILVVAIAVPSLIAGKGDAAKGKALYMKKCASCHGLEGEAKEAIAKALKVEMRHLDAKEVQAKSDTKLAEDVTKGTGKMKPVTGLKDDEVADIVAFMRSLAKK